MNHQSFFSIFFLFILTINYSLTSSYFDQENDVSEDTFDQSDENYLQNILADQNHHKWRRQTEFTPIRVDLINKNNPKSSLLKYDLLLHRWILRNRLN